MTPALRTVLLTVAAGSYFASLELADDWRPYTAVLCFLLAVACVALACLPGKDGGS